MLLFFVNCKIPSTIDSVATALFPKKLIQAAIFIETRVWLIIDYVLPSSATGTLANITQFVGNYASHMKR